MQWREDAFGNGEGWRGLSYRPLKAVSALSHRLVFHTLRSVNYVPGKKCF